MFGIKDGYIENPRPVYFLDDPKGITFQPDVYALAEVLAELAAVSSIVDVGCGWADKLAAIHNAHPGWSFTGVDFGDNLDHCRDSYPWGTWVEHDLEQPFPLDATDSIVICSDVIEHLADPRPLVKTLAASDARLIVLSTPERDVQHGYDHMGPSPNLCHIREWNAEELVGFLGSEGLSARFAGLTRGNDEGWAMATQVLLAT